MTPPYNAYGAWERVPWWHPRTWLFWGTPMRRWCWDSIGFIGEHDGTWEYASYVDCAKLVLEDTYGQN